MADYAVVQENCKNVVDSMTVFIALPTINSLSCICCRCSLRCRWSLITLGRFRFRLQLRKQLETIDVDETNSSRLKCCLKAKCGFKEQCSTPELTLSNTQHFCTILATRNQTWEYAQRSKDSTKVQTSEGSYDSTRSNWQPEALRSQPVLSSDWLSICLLPKRMNHF